MPQLPDHLANMVLFTLHTGVRDDVVSNLRRDWEIRVPLDGKEISVFEVPREHVKGRKQVRCVVCNSVAQSVIDSQRVKHKDYVFVYRRERVKNLDQAPVAQYKKVGGMNSSGWQTARKKAGLDDLHVHDLRHTTGMRLREAGVAQATISDVLWHQRVGTKAHCTTAQVRRICAALEKIVDETGQENRSLRSLAREAKGLLKSKAPSEALRKEKRVRRFHV